MRPLISLLTWPVISLPSRTAAHAQAPARVRCATAAGLAPDRWMPAAGQAKTLAPRRGRSLRSCEAFYCRDDPLRTGAVHPGGPAVKPDLKKDTNVRRKLGARAALRARSAGGSATSDRHPAVGEMNVARHRLQRRVVVVPEDIDGDENNHGQDRTDERTSA